MKITKIDGEGLVFDNGTTLNHYHDQDCCESVYADWESLKTESGIMDHEFKETLEIEGVEDSGFRLEGFFVPCYNSQNGYYSSDLSLVIGYPKPGIKTTLDITEFVLDQID